MASVSTSYDYVIVGAGTAGCVIAAQLSEHDGARVLLLEAGSRDPQPLGSVPPAWPKLLGTPASWGESTVAQAATGTPMPFPRGRGLGGSSAINGMIFVRGHRSSYDAWVAAGAKGWGFDDLLPYLCRSENAVGRDPVVRGVDGPLLVGPSNPRHPVAEAVLAAAVETGFATATDISSGLEQGFGWNDLSIADGRRFSAADAYLAPAMGRPDLDVVTNALVHRVTTEAGRATGVEYSVGAEQFRARCEREVVLTAGTVGSAQLLLRSGIGPQSHLRDVGVETVLHLPGVGANLQDHPQTTVVYSPARPVPPSANNHAEVTGLIRSDLALDGPDLQFLAVDMSMHSHAPAGSGQGYAIACALMTPRSRGTVRLTSGEPGAAPAIDPNYYGDPHDLEVMLTGLRIAREIGRASALTPWRGFEAMPGRAAQDDADLRAHLRSNLLTYFHPVGTCRIGTDTDAVVDTELRVHGIGGLRIADASVMPTIVSGNTNATVYGIAERAADLIAGASS
ncbi:GMC family oxidoreductase [Pseudonocardia yunnanensis]|uniref:GMC family oxidoreductase n=1 Tax=Pseudonocardia yunnanensis TaxID=58107 RepID=A0ABW4ESM3_9PSEU